jgi:hypothetical protein
MLLVLASLARKSHLKITMVMELINYLRNHLQIMVKWKTRGQKMITLQIQFLKTQKKSLIIGVMNKSYRNNILYRIK